MIIGAGYPASYFLEFGTPPSAGVLGRPPYGALLEAGFEVAIGKAPSVRIPEEPWGVVLT